MTAEHRMSHRAANRIPDTDWAEVLSYPGGESLALGHLKDVSEGGISVDLPQRLCSGTKVQVKLSHMTPAGLLRHYAFTGTVVHAEVSGQGVVHGIQFSEVMSPAEQLVLTDYLCHVEFRTAS
jgi:PilZ domain-containing protein